MALDTIRPLLEEVRGAVGAADAAASLDDDGIAAGECFTGTAPTADDDPAPVAASPLACLDLENMASHGIGPAVATVSTVLDVFPDKVREAMLGVMPSTSALKKGPSVASDRVAADPGMLTAGILAALPAIAKMKVGGKKTVRAPKQTGHRPAAQVADMVAYGARAMVQSGYNATRAATWQRHCATFNKAAAILEGSNSDGTYAPASNGAAPVPRSDAWLLNKPGARNMLTLMGRLRSIRAAIAEAERAGWRGVSEEDHARLVDGAQAVAAELAGMISMEAETSAHDGMVTQGITPDEHTGM